jgi:hypothetical protein
VSKTSIRKIYKKILEQLESSVTLRGNTGGGANHPHQARTKRVYGKSEIAHQADIEEVDERHQEKDEEVETDEPVVDVSRAFGSKESV